jgi:hypothetical protein
MLTGRWLNFLIHIPLLKFFCDVEEGNYFNKKYFSKVKASVQFLARHTKEVFPAEPLSHEDMERHLGKWRWMNVLYEFIE